MVARKVKGFPSLEPLAGAPLDGAGPGLIAAYAFAYLGVWMAALTPVIVSLPVRVRQIDPSNYVSDLSAILSVGAVVAMLANPLFGRLSDRTTSKIGMRRPWLIAGGCVGVIGAAIIAFLPSIYAIGVGWCLAQTGVNILLAVTTAILPDQIPPFQRGRVSGYLSIAISAAPVIGAFFARHLQAFPSWMFLMPALLAAIGSGLLAAVLKDRRMDPSEVPPYDGREFLRSFWVDWTAYPDYTWIWLSRFLRFIGIALLISYQQYFVVDKLGATDVPHVVLNATMISAMAGIIGASVAGYWSDRTRRHKRFVLAGTLIFAAGMFVLAFSHSVSVFYLALAIAGLGQGMFLAIDFAVVVAVLPQSESEAAKNLGVFNIANALPQSIAPAAAPFVLGIGSEGSNYRALFCLAGLAALVGATVIPLIRKAD